MSEYPYETDVSRKKKKRRKKALKIASVVLLGVVVFCCGLSSVVAYLSGPSEKPPLPTQASPVLATLVPEPTNTPAPVDTPVTVLPSLLDRQFLLVQGACVAEGAMLPALVTLSEASASEPISVVEFCAAAANYQVAVEIDQSCWVEVPLPVDPVLQEAYRLYDLALDDHALAAGLVLDFCTTGNIESLTQATDVMAGVSQLVDLATEALDQYSANLTQ